MGYGRRRPETVPGEDQLKIKVYVPHSLGENKRRRLDKDE